MLSFGFAFPALRSRSLLTRAKKIYSARAEYVNPHWIYLDVVTSAGTYVKEFVVTETPRKDKATWL